MIYPDLLSLSGMAESVDLLIQAFLEYGLIVSLNCFC